MASLDSLTVHVSLDAATYALRTILDLADKTVGRDYQAHISTNLAVATAARHALRKAHAEQSEVERLRADLKVAVREAMEELWRDKEWDRLKPINAEGILWETMVADRERMADILRRARGVPDGAEPVYPEPPKRVALEEVGQADEFVFTKVIPAKGEPWPNDDPEAGPLVKADTGLADEQFERVNAALKQAADEGLLLHMEKYCRERGIDVRESVSSLPDDLIADTPALRPAREV